MGGVIGDSRSRRRFDIHSETETILRRLVPMRSLASIVACLVTANLSACGDFPRDAEDTLKQVEAGRPLRVGWSGAAPWVRATAAGEPAGIEPDVLRSWAASRGIRIQWIEAGEAQLVEGLNENSLDVALAGFTTSAPHGGLIGMTQPYLDPKVVIGMPPGAAPPESWEGVTVSYDPQRPEFAGLLLREKAAPTTSPAAYRILYEAELASSGLVAAKELRTDRRTIAIAPSANALTLALDRWLHANRAAIEARLAREGRP
jgi:ABC-type amino acid transport substrate-binding protein